MDDNWIRKHEIEHEEIDTKLDTILEFVSLIPDMNERLGRVEQTVNEHTGILKVHGELLREHSATLREHSATLKEQSADLTEIKHLLGGALEDITELKAVSHSH